MLTITALPAFQDNYIWLLQNPQTHCCAVVDPGDATPVLSWLDAHPDWTLTDILITHHHQDHTGGVHTLKQRSAATVYGPALEDIAHLDQPLQDEQQIDVLNHTFRVLHVPGHTKGHIAYVHQGTTDAPILFSGDTLFAAGCGRLFEGTAEQMFTSLQRFAALPHDTRVYCTHEYTLSNLKFAAAVEPSNQVIQQRLQDVTEQRAQLQITLPSSLATELTTNPFLRCSAPELVSTVSQQHGAPLAANNPVAVFAALRAWKDSF